jgi:hypothetical protein
MLLLCLSPAFLSCPRPRSTSLIMLPKIWFQFQHLWTMTLPLR